MKISSPTFLLIFVITWGANSSVTATPEQHLQSGDQLAQSLLSKVSQDQQNAGAHPFYQSSSPEAGPSDGDLRGRVETAARGNAAAQMIRESSGTRPHFKIDPERDPLLTGAERIVSQPLTIIGGDGTHVVQTTQEGVDETLSCEEPGEDSIETCLHTLNVKVVKTKIAKEWQGYFYMGKCSDHERRGHYFSCGALRNAVSAVTARRWGWRRQAAPLDPQRLIITDAYKSCQVELASRGGLGCECRTWLPPLICKPDQIKQISLLSNPSYPQSILMTAQHCHTYKSGRCEWWFQPVVKITYEEEKIDILPDEWISQCQGLEERADQGLCSYVSKECTQGKQTRVIDGVPITRDCWQETYTYSCSYPSKDDCGPLRARGCVQISSACKQRIGAACVVYSQTYQCKGNKITRDRITGGATPFCLDGACRDQGFESNDEMMSSLAQLSILKELQGQLWNGTLFKGADNRCSKCTLSFKDCCGSGKGWGVDLGLAGCSADEKALRLKRQKGLCHFVGTYCSKREKITKICLQKKSSYCCFGSKLLKAFHTQGRPQIGMGWGSPEEPLCRGFTIDEIQRIDFSKLDLREAFEDLMQNFKPGKMEGLHQKINERLEIMKQGVRPKTEPQVRQRGEA